MKQCKVNGNGIFICGLEDVYDYIRKFVNDDFADAMEDIVFKEISDREDEKTDALSELEDAQDEIDSLEEQLSSTEEELDEARQTISELQDELNEQ